MQAATSVTYCQDHRHTGFDTAGSSNASYKNSVFGTNPACLSLTEVANLPALANAGGIKVVKDHDAVVARYLFVYAEGTIIAGGASTDRMKIPKWDDTCVSI